jgi:aquaporin NIP
MATTVTSIEPLAIGDENATPENAPCANNFNRRPSLPARLLCELLGTCLFVLFGAGCATKASADLVAVSAAHGIVTVWLVYVFGSVSGGHFNAGATLVFLLDRQMKLNDSLLYIIAQALGALFAGALLLWLYYGTNSTLGTPQLATKPYVVTIAQGFGIEFICTTVLSFVLLFTTSYNTKKETAFAVGLIVFSSFLLGADRDGAALNPWRWFGPAVASNTYDSYAWIYTVGPLGGFVFGFVLFRAYQRVWNW